MDALKVNVNNIDAVAAQMFVDAQEKFEGDCENESLTKINLITDIGMNIVLIKHLCTKIITNLEMLEDLDGITNKN